MLKIDEVLVAIYEKHKEIINQEKHPEGKINIAVYMDYEYYSMCVFEEDSMTSFTVSALLKTGKILGFPVYRVAPIQVPAGEIKHPGFRVVNLDG